MCFPFLSPNTGPGRSPVRPNPFAGNTGASASPSAPAYPPSADPFAPATVNPGPSTTVTDGRPASVQNATYARLLAGGLTLALAGFGIWAIIDLRDLLDRLLNFDLTHTTTFIIKDYADVTEFVLTVSVAAVAALLAAAYVTVAASVWRTTRWPRIVRAVLTPARAGGPNR